MKAIKMFILTSVVFSISNLFVFAQTKTDCELLALNMFNFKPVSMGDICLAVRTDKISGIRYVLHSKTDKILAGLHNTRFYVNPYHVLEEILIPMPMIFIFKDGSKGLGITVMPEFVSIAYKGDKSFTPNFGHNPKMYEDMFLKEVLIWLEGMEVGEKLNEISSLKLKSISDIDEGIIRIGDIDFDLMKSTYDQQSYRVKKFKKYVERIGGFGKQPNQTGLGPSTRKMLSQIISVYYDDNFPSKNSGE